MWMKAMQLAVPCVKAPYTDKNNEFSDNRSPQTLKEGKRKGGMRLALQNRYQSVVH